MRPSRLLASLPVLYALAGCAAPVPAQPRTVVFFTADSAGLDNAARTVIRKAALDAEAAPAATVHVLGFAAPDSGSAAYNRALAQARAQAVADGLVAAGVPAAHVVIQSRGMVPYAAMPTEARRVEIQVGG